MPDLDVTDLLCDPDLTDRFTVLRRTQGNGPNGVNVVTVVGTHCVRGYVGPAGNNALERLPDFQFMSKTVEVKTTFKLRGPAESRGTSYAPDLVAWPITNGDTFVVADVQDWSRFGAGFVSAVCISQDHVDAPPGRVSPLQNGTLTVPGTVGVLEPDDEVPF
jgi:hypothetical protein